jgi:hypothetical protein
METCNTVWYAITRGADKSLARPGRKQATATEFLIFIYPFYNHNWRNISTIYIYKTRLASNKIDREVSRAKNLSAPLYSWTACFRMFVYRKNNAMHQNKSEPCHESVDSKPHPQPLFLISRSKVTVRRSVTRFVFVVIWGQLSATWRPHLSLLSSTHTSRGSILNWVMTSSLRQTNPFCWIC